MNSQEYQRGYETGRKARQKGKPHPLTEGRSPAWIEGCDKGYKGRKEKVDLVSITVKVPDELRRKAIALGINRSYAARVGLTKLMQEATKMVVYVRIEPLDTDPLEFQAVGECRMAFSDILSNLNLSREEVYLLGGDDCDAEDIRGVIHNCPDKVYAYRNNYGDWCYFGTES